ncbi:hypothetical protein llap_1365 [Limosa lapponica baueri]|uniref:Uncharacterized protein n=1 Tax=Limosa lapponica baueri TaxID=1758121 RepID=A0A2I0UQP4_LIMLA|nr:hypothetical protein llap_1365 [Limosa lapponica baueri]
MVAWMPKFSITYQDYTERLMNTQGLIITITVDRSLGEEEVGKHPPFTILEGFMRQLFTQNKVQIKKKIIDGNNNNFEIEVPSR